MPSVVSELEPSRVGAHPTVVHTSWAIAGALDCLQNGKLLVLAELGLEVPPPMGAFRNRHLSAAVTDPVYSRLLDPRWAEVAMSRLRDESDFMEKRTKLTQRFLPTKTAENEDPANPDGPSAKPKVRPPREKKTKLHDSAARQ